MTLFTLEHGELAYRADAAFYAVAVSTAGVWLASTSPVGVRLETLAWAAAGLAAWSLIEYGVHRFVLHGPQPFRGWHAAHHRRPSAFICAPTVVSATLIFTLVYLPMLAAAGARQASAFTWGVLAGYLGYTVLHHAVHHWRGRGRWLRRRKRWHARHHQGCGGHERFGVSTGLWDRVLGTSGRETP
jgi:sterol desaturase/sphingolipid hydroxylase (fatty acid hydroxylase superfamily)